MSIPNRVNLNHCKLGLINPKSPTNVGSVLRAAGCYQAEEIIYTGQRYDNARSFATDTKKAKQHIPMTRREHIFDLVPADYVKIAIELVEGATPLPQFSHPEKAMYIFGPEDGTIPQAILNQCSHVLYVPTTGCLNLAATVNVLLYDRMAKNAETQCGDHIIRQSRDTNNRTVVRT
ncbi:RNA methyltransferase [Aliiglaciecola sp. LCG003]|uniref:RNA methyltransferase n=1 Tax=Aliiglaciecola sp. LCG003 TaxID=3053655 RepID=UPI002572DDB3|nr:RNA methyltransferase [Aliiglaciecola sp. LCG003]WJG10919.1 RNA methyltransferase [Aliiglaciecola sp. LCG003]